MQPDGTKVLVVSFILAFPPISNMHASSPHSYYTPSPSHPPSLDHSNSTWRRVQVMKTPYYSVFSSLLSLHVSSIQIFSSPPCSQTPSAYVPPLMTETQFHTHRKVQAKLYFCIFCYGFRQKTRSFWTEWLQALPEFNLCYGQKKTISQAKNGYFCLLDTQY
jgi:hypothetical protein